MRTCVLAGQWVARIGGTLLTLLFLTFLFGEGPPPLSALRAGEGLMFLGVAGMVVGLSLAWKWEGIGGLVTVAGYGLFLLIDPGAISATIFLACGAFGLLHLLLRHQGKIVRRERLLRDVWGDDYFGDTRTLDTHIAWLRKKIESTGDVRIVAVRGIGYRLDAHPPAAR